MMTPNTDTGDESIATALVKSTWHESLSDATADIGDIALDQLLDTDVLRDIPVVGWFLKARAVFGAARDTLLLKKILRFLEGLADVSEEDRAAFEARLTEDPKQATRVGEQLLLYIDRHEHFDKSYYTGLVYAAFIGGRIDRDMFERLAASIDQLDANTLKRFPTLYGSLANVPNETGQQLVLAGLADIYFTVHDIRVVDAPKPAGSGMFNYKKTKLGEALAAILKAHTATSN